MQLSTVESPRASRSLDVNPHVGFALAELLHIDSVARLCCTCRGWRAWFNQPGPRVSFATIEAHAFVHLCVAIWRRWRLRDFEKPTAAEILLVQVMAHQVLLPAHASVTMDSAPPHSDILRVLQTEADLIRLGAKFGSSRWPLFFTIVEREWHKRSRRSVFHALKPDHQVMTLPTLGEEIASRCSALASSSSSTRTKKKRGYSVVPTQASSSSSSPSSAEPDTFVARIALGLLGLRVTRERRGQRRASDAPPHGSECLQHFSH